jgi:hypothetical protein
MKHRSRSSHSHTNCLLTGSCENKKKKISSFMEVLYLLILLFLFVYFQALIQTDECIYIYFIYTEDNRFYLAICVFPELFSTWMQYWSIENWKSISILMLIYKTDLKQWLNHSKDAIGPYFLRPSKFSENYTAVILKSFENTVGATKFSIFQWSQDGEVENISAIE